jgi:zinc transport system substrate-binding protein
VAAAVLLVCATGCRPASPTENGPRVAVTSSYLEAAVRDLLGADTPVLRLSEPGSCPGHFDLRPSQAGALRGCVLLLRFDFQKGLDARLAGGAGRRSRVAAVRVPGGMAQPTSYAAACRQTAEALVAAGLLGRDRAGARLAAITRRLAALAEEAQRAARAAGWRDTPVLASTHQRDFCAWLGLRVVGVFRGADTASIREIETAIRRGREAGARWVIANRPEGRRTADALAERLGARVVVFENFPTPGPAGLSFDALVRANLRALREAAGS